MEEVTALVIVGLAGLTLGILAQGALRGRRQLAAAAAPPPAAPPATDAPLAAGLGGAATSVVLEVVTVVLAATERDPEVLGELSWIEGLLADGYAIALWLEADSRRVSREIDALLEQGAGSVEEVPERSRRRNDLDRRARLLRDRLDALHALVRAHATNGD